MSFSSEAIDNWEAFQRYYDAGHEEYVEHADKCDNFYVGNQWDDEDIADLEAQGKPALTINIAMRSINAIKSAYSSQRADIIFKPRKDATEPQATIMTQLMDQILESNDFQDVEKSVFDSGIITDRGYFDVRLDFEDNMFGEVSITEKDSRSVLLHPDASKYDPSTWPGVMITDWWKVDDLAAVYGEDKLDELKQMVSTGEYQGTRSVRFSGTKNEEPWMANTVDGRELREVRVIDHQFYVRAMQSEWVDLVTGDTKPIPEGMTKERAQEIADQLQLGVRSRLRRRIKWVVSADHILLHEGWSPYDYLTIVPYFPYFRPGKPAGVMKQLLSPQEQLNKTESQELHIVNTTANSGYTVEAGSLVNMTTDELEERGAETGLVIEYARGRNPPDKIQPNQIPTGLENLARKSASYLSEIPGVTPLVGTELKSDVAGVAIQRAQSAAHGGLQGMFDNLAYTRKWLARCVTSMVQKYYTEPRVMRATDWRAPENESREFSINTNLLNNITMGTYDIVVSSAPARDTFEDVQFAEALELRNAGIQIPDHFIIDSSHLARKREISDLLKQLQGFAEPTPEQQQRQAMMDKFQLQQAVLTLQEMGAKVAKLQSEAMKNKAQAGSMQADSQTKQFTAQHDAQFDWAKLQTDIQGLLGEFQNKLMLADKHIDANQAETRYKQMGNLLEKSMDLQAKTPPEPTKRQGRNIPTVG